MSAPTSNLDLVFAMDCTGSMGAYIASATENIRLIVDEIVAKESINIRLALIEYRDHPPQDTTFVTRVHGFTNAVPEMKGWLQGCSANGGGDGPEAVADALHEAFSLPWRSDATKICILIADAPPHGLVRNGDSFPDGCPAGHDPLAIARQMFEKSIMLYTVGAEPSIVPYRDFFMSLAVITTGQYVPMVDAKRLAQMIINSVREEISLDRATQESKIDIARVMVKSKADGVDDAEAARRVQRLFSEKKVVVSQMRNESGIPSKVAEESYSKCSDMSDMQRQYEPTQPSTTKPANMDYALEENTSLSFEQAKRIVQKAKGWDYSAMTAAETTSGTPCRHGAGCTDHSNYHRARYTHPTNATKRAETRHATGETACRHGEGCHDHSEYHRTRYTHPTSSDRPTQTRREDTRNRTACRHGESCHDHTEYHRSRYSHPEHSDGKTKCRHGTACYDRSDQHRRKYSHLD